MKTTKEMIAVMQAYADGEAIQRQVLDGGIWTNVSSDSPVWDWGYFDYRVQRKVMMQMWRDAPSVELRARPVKQPPLYGEWLKIGEPFEFTYPRESE